jgi:hypothetical protein
VIHVVSRREPRVVVELPLFDWFEAVAAWPVSQRHEVRRHLPGVDRQDLEPFRPESFRVQKP